MLQNFLKTTLRNMGKSKVHSFINITGLSIGMAVAILIGLWIQDELAFDHYHLHHARLAQVWDTQTWNGETGTGPGIDIPLAAELRAKYAGDFSQIALSSPIEEGHILAVDDKKIISSGMWAEPELPAMLTLKIINGNGIGLKDPSSILIAASLAKTLFGSEGPINKVVRVDNKWAMKVAGVFEDLPYNSSFNASKFFLPWGKFVTTQSKEDQTGWGRHGYRLFVQLNDPANIDKITAKIKDIPKEYIKEGKEEI